MGTGHPDLSDPLLDMPVLMDVLKIDLNEVSGCRNDFIRILSTTEDLPFDDCERMQSTFNH